MEKNGGCLVTLVKYARTSICSVTGVNTVLGIQQGCDINKGPRAVSPTAGGLGESTSLYLGSPITVSSRSPDSFGTVRPPEVSFLSHPLVNGVDGSPNSLPLAPYRDLNTSHTYNLTLSLNNILPRNFTKVQYKTTPLGHTY